MQSLTTKYFGIDSIPGTNILQSAKVSSRFVTLRSVRFSFHGLLEVDYVSINFCITSFFPFAELVVVN